MTKGTGSGVSMWPTANVQSYIAANAEPSKIRGAPFSPKWRCETWKGPGRSRKRRHRVSQLQAASTAGTRPNTSTRRHCGIRCPPPTCRHRRL